jgi:hypothetical protein
MRFTCDQAMQREHNKIEVSTDSLVIDPGEGRFVKLTFLDSKHGSIRASCILLLPLSTCASDIVTNKVLEHRWQTAR